ncbi:MAG: hypothetical protein M1281_17115 [Chloroflexi bacterium]|nr:hypothetical protein [Chloroflexota bacterium]
MDGKWVVEKDFASVVRRIMDFEPAEMPMTIKPIRMRPGFALLGCYVPTQPRPTSLLSGKLLVRSLAGSRTEVSAEDFSEWAGPFLQSLIASL